MFCGHLDPHYTILELSLVRINPHTQPLFSDLERKENYWQWVDVEDVVAATGKETSSSSKGLFEDTVKWHAASKSDTVSKGGKKYQPNKRTFLPDTVPLGRGSFGTVLDCSEFLSV